MARTMFILLLTCLISTITATALFPLQNTTLPPTRSTPTSTNATTATLLNEEGCFSYAPQPIAIFRDCIGIINTQIAIYPDLTSPLTFSRSGKPDIRVPYVRYAANCAIVLDVAEPDGAEHTNMGDVVARAKGLAVDCVIGGPAHQGGEVYIGWGRKLRVAVLGRSAEGGWGDVEGVDGVDLGGTEEGVGKLPVVVLEGGDGVGTVGTF